MKSLYEDRDGDIWMGTIGGGVGKFKGEKIIAITKQDGLCDNNILVLFKIMTIICGFALWVVEYPF
ncbi:MAG: hypothetical protein IPO25_18760 [Saprospiraceae bacterium]|nr:hypothetical protein [Saprospiraceae bacterium]